MACYPGLTHATTGIHLWVSPGLSVAQVGGARAPSPDGRSRSIYPRRTGGVRTQTTAVAADRRAAVADASRARIR